MKKESRRAFTLSYLAENEPYGWLVERCNAIAQGKPLSHCWNDYMLSSNAFMDWVLQSPLRAIQVANALALAQIGRGEQAANAKRLNDEAESAFRRRAAERAQSQPLKEMPRTTALQEQTAQTARCKPKLGPI
ncbi:MAG: hypothetical protein ACKVP9_00500 [Burkholderiales bacterium]